MLAMNDNRDGGDHVPAGLTARDTWEALRGIGLRPTCEIGCAKFQTVECPRRNLIGSQSLMTQVCFTRSPHLEQKVDELLAQGRQGMPEAAD